MAQDTRAAIEPVTDAVPRRSLELPLRHTKRPDEAAASMRPPACTPTPPAQPTTPATCCACCTVNNPILTIQGRVRQVHAFFRQRSPAQMLTIAAPHSSPWLPEGYVHNFKEAA
jgi:hypothetical protein